MRYLIEGSLEDSVRPTRQNHEQYTAIIRDRIVPGLKTLLAGQTPGRLLAGGFRAGGSDVYMIVDFPDAKTHLCIRRLIATLPFDVLFHWRATPLETFEEIVDLYKDA